LEILRDFIGALDQSKLRVTRPSRFIFFCGGVITPKSKKSPSLRDFLLRTLATKGSRIDDAKLVCAEEANSLFKESKYKSLIEFESDIAEIAELVLLIGESPGSLAELGAFSMTPILSKNLAIVAQSSYRSQESFIRDGPLRYMEAHYPGSVLWYPWFRFRGGHIVKSSAKPHVQDLVDEVTEILSKRPRYESLSTHNGHRMLLAYWTTHVLRGAEIKDVQFALQCFGTHLPEETIRNFMFCMRVAGWVGELPYGHRVYFYPKVDVDPLKYAFKTTAKQNDPIRWKRDVADEVSKGAKRPKVVLTKIGSLD
jgi:hypothetical protein